MPYKISIYLAVFVSATSTSPSHGDSSEWSGRSFREAPILAERVRRGEIPPLEERLPEVPMVVQPIDRIGQYGGTWYRMMKGSSDYHAYSRCIYEQMLRWKPTPTGGIEVAPGLVEAWEFTDGHKTLTLHLRRGLKWSDGHPFSADDILFWWEKIAQDENLTATIPRFWQPNGVPMQVVKGDNHTITLKFATPYPLALKYLPFKGNQWPLVFERTGFFAPAHYLGKYLPDSAANSAATYAIFEEKASDYNPERPVMSAWKMVDWDPGNRLIAERNPYYWKVDPAGNQLPYLDKIEMEIFLNTEMINFRAVSGRLQMQQRHFNWEDRDLLQAFAPERDYRLFEYEITVIRGIMMNLQYPGDPVLRKLFQDRRFRIAMSMSIDRDLINQLCYRGRGVVCRMELHPSSPDYIAVEDLPDYLVFDPRRARTLLDEIGLVKRDSDGYRIGPDGRTVSLIIELHNVQGPDMDAVEIVRSNWEEVGIKTALKPEERTLYFQRVHKNGEHMIAAIGIEGGFPLLNSGVWFGTDPGDAWAHHWAKWFLSKGERGVEPPPAVKRLQEIQTVLAVTGTRQGRQKLWEEVMHLHAENMWVIPLVAQNKTVGVLRNDFLNVPERGIASWVTMTPGYLSPETFFIER